MKIASFFAVLFFLSSFATAQTNMVERNKATIKAAYDALNRRDFNTFATYCAPDYVEYSAGPMPIKGVQASIEAYKQFFSAFPDLKFEIVYIAAEGDHYLVKINMTGTNTGALMGFPPTGKPIKVADVDIIKVNSEGKAVAHSSSNPNEPFVQVGYAFLMNPNTFNILTVYQQFGAGDIAGVLSNCSDGVVFDLEDRMLDSKERIFKGKEQVAAFFKEINSKFQYAKFQPVQFFADGDDVIVLLDIEYSYLPDGKKYSNHYFHHFKVVNNKITYFNGIDGMPKM